MRKLKKKLCSLLICLCMAAAFFPATAGAMEIYIDLTVVGKANLTIAVESGDSVDNVKQIIQSKTGFPAGRQRLFFDGKELEEGRTLADYNIQKDFTLELLSQSARAIQLGAGRISGYAATDSYDCIYFGNWTAPDNHTTSGPVKWRVLDAKTNTKSGGLFLLTEGLFGEGDWGGVRFSDNTAPGDVWQGSAAQDWCKAFFSERFSKAEQDAVLATTKSDNRYESESGNKYIFPYSNNILSEDRVFFLSGEEAENSAYGFANDSARIAAYGSASTWWLLRSLCEHTYIPNIVGVVSPIGEVNFVFCTTHWTARPAFNLDLSKVLFTSAAEGGKSAGGMDGGLSAVDDYTGSEWKLTLSDSSRSGFSVSADAVLTSAPGDSVEFHYAGANTGTNEYISAMLLDDTDEILYYGRLKNLADSWDAEGTATFTVPGELAKGIYTVRLFNEQYNGDKQTDYAGELKNFTLTVEDKAAPPSP